MPISTRDSFSRGLTAIILRLRGAFWWRARPATVSSSDVADSATSEGLSPGHGPFSHPRSAVDDSALHPARDRHHLAGDVPRELVRGEHHHLPRDVLRPGDLP